MALSTLMCTIWLEAAILIILSNISVIVSVRPKHNENNHKVRYGSIINKFSLCDRVTSSPRVHIELKLNPST